MIFSPRSSIVRRLTSGICLGLVTLAMSVSQAIAAPYVFAPFDVTATFDVDEFVLAPTPLGEIYTSYSVTLDWDAIAGDPFSDEALIAFSDDLFNPTVIHLFPEPADNGASDNGDSTTLEWSGFFETSYVGGDPISFSFAQDFPGSSAFWSNISITFDTLVPVTPSSIGLTVPQPGESPFSVTASLAANEVVWFNFTYTGGDLLFDTLGSLLPDVGDGLNDTELGLFDATGVLILDTNDIDFPNMLESAFGVPDGALIIGDIYYIALSGYDTTFANDFNVVSTSPLAGTYQLNVTNITSVPESSPAVLIGLGGLLGIGVTVIKRRRGSV